MTQYVSTKTISMFVDLYLAIKTLPDVIDFTTNIEQ